MILEADLEIVKNCPWLQELHILLACIPTFARLPSSHLHSLFLGANGDLCKQRQVLTKIGHECPQESGLLLLFSVGIRDPFHLKMHMTLSQGRKAHRIKCLKKLTRDTSYLVYM